MFIAHFHPALVHLPIGILLLAVLMQWIPGKERGDALAPAISYAYFAGGISAILSCISGWLLASGGGYDENTLLFHRWMGVGVAVVSAAGYYLARHGKKGLVKWISLLLFVLLMITGHLGGTLTHGEGYLTKDVSTGKDSAASKTIANAQEAVVYKDIIQPVLQQKCYSCHSVSKQKGGLRVDEQAFILKGGKEGAVVTPGNPESSELYKRVVLDPLEEKHMPPKGKEQLTENERLLLHWWIATGMDFTAKAKALEQPPSVKIALTSLEKKAAIVLPDVPTAAVNKAPDTILTSLQKMGATVLPVAVNNNYLTANLVTIKELTPAITNALLGLKDQLIWLRMPGINAGSAGWKQIAGLKNLIKLSIEHSNISDESLAEFTGLEKLQYLNLVDTKITAQALLKLKSLKELQNIYLGQTGLSSSDLVAVKATFPKAKIDSGGYHISFLPGDTALVKKEKAPAKK